MPVRLEGCSEPYEPKDTDPVECTLHGTATVWGHLDAIQQLALEEGIDTDESLPCILSPAYRRVSPPKGSP